MNTKDSECDTIYSSFIVYTHMAKEVNIYRVSGWKVSKNKNFFTLQRIYYKYLWLFMLIAKKKKKVSMNFNVVTLGFLTIINVQMLHLSYFLRHRCFLGRGDLSCQWDCESTQMQDLELQKSTYHRWAGERQCQSQRLGKPDARYADWTFLCFRRNCHQDLVSGHAGTVHATPATTSNRLSTWQGTATLHPHH